MNAAVICITSDIWSVCDILLCVCFCSRLKRRMGYYLFSVIFLFFTSLCTFSFRVLQLSRVRLGSFWRWRLRSVPSVQQEAIPSAAASASTNGIPCLLDSVAWQPRWKTIPVEMTDSAATGVWVGCKTNWKMDCAKLIFFCSLQLFLGASGKLFGVQQRWMHSLSHLCCPSEETRLCQFWVPVSRQQPAVWILCEFQTFIIFLLLGKL